MKNVLFIILFIPFISYSQNKVDVGDTLYNGIVLSSVWPPHTESLSNASPMRVPYLESIPSVIPIDVGRQLFVDDFLVEKTNLVRVFHQAKKYEGNPVFYPETSYELDENKGYSAVTYLGHGGVFFDPAEGLFKMFYTAGWRGGLAMATSQNLIDWERPDMGIIGHSNLLFPGDQLWAGEDNSIWLDLNTKKRDQRLKYMTDRRGLPSCCGRHTLQVSEDGKVWSQGLFVTQPAGDYSSFFYNPFRKVWAFSIKCSDKGPRSRNYSESKDFLKGIDWKNDAVFWVRADSLDQPDPIIGDQPQLYSLNAVAYESILLGEFYIHLGPANGICKKGKYPKTTELKIGFSRDGFHWDRPDRRAFINATRKEGEWDRGYLHGTTGVCLVIGDKIWFPYCGYSGIAPDGTKGMYTGASIGMATLRRDGFASMESASKKGYLQTRSVKFSGRYLFVNVDCPEGELRVEIIDDSGHVIPSFSRSNSVSVKVDKTLQKIEWKNGGDLSALKGKTVKFRFFLDNGKLYSFWVSSDESGASYGYLGGGSPGYEGVVDDQGIDAYKCIE